MHMKHGLPCVAVAIQNQTIALDRDNVIPTATAPIRIPDGYNLDRDSPVPTATAPIRIPDGYNLDRDSAVPTATAPIRIPDGYNLDSSRFDCDQITGRAEPPKSVGRRSGPWALSASRPEQSAALGRRRRKAGCEKTWRARLERPSRALHRRQKRDRESPPASVAQCGSPGWDFHRRGPEWPCT